MRLQEVRTMEQSHTCTRAVHQVPLHTVGLEAKLQTHTHHQVLMQLLVHQCYGLKGMAKHCLTMWEIGHHPLMVWREAQHSDML